MKQIEGGVTAAKGFMAASCEAEIKYKNRKDMAMIFSTAPAKLAATFTKNVVKAAPVLWDKAVLESKEEVQAIVVNSGIANACTGQEGMDICEKTAEAVASAFGGEIAGKNVLICSTGVIGMQIPIDRIQNGVSQLVVNLAEGRDAAHEAAKAIMTTDTKPKEIALSLEIGGKEVHIGGMCKGSGMIHPNMCTMLSFVTTDCAITQEMLQKALSIDVEDSYNMVSVDGDTSTNDTCLLLANGLSENPVIDKEGADFDRFLKALHVVNEVLAKKMAEDGEGATHLFEVKVVNAYTKPEAVLLAKSVVGSSLTKAAIYGQDANWGRILAAMGYSGADFDPNTVELYFVNDIGKIKVFDKGTPVDFDEDYAKEILQHSEVTALIDMNEGEAKATAWGCDLTHEYVNINADYRS